MIDLPLPGVLIDGELELKLLRTYQHRLNVEYLPAYEFEMYQPQLAGNIRFRFGESYDLRMYFGHIGFQVKPEFRGHHLAERSCRLLFPLARQIGVCELWITCNPDNLASRRTCERLGGELIEIVKLPSDNVMYHKGEREKCRYRIDL